MTLLTDCLINAEEYSDGSSGVRTERSGVQRELMCSVNWQGSACRSRYGKILHVEQPIRFQNNEKVQQKVDDDIEF